MAAVEQRGAGDLPLRHPATLARLRWPQIMAISIFWLALNFHQAAPGIIILPSQVFKMVGNAQPGEALAFVLVPGAFFGMAIIYCLPGTVTVPYIRGVKWWRFQATSSTGSASSSRWRSSLRGAPVPFLRSMSISAAMLSAISSGVSAPRSRPMGE